jgi:hypothetical protein
MHIAAHYVIYNAAEAVSNAAVSELQNVHSIHQAATDYFKSGKSVSKQSTYSIHMTQHQNAIEAHKAFMAAAPSWEVYGFTEMGDQWELKAPEDAKTGSTVCQDESHNGD